jgi:5-oxoprolinase (ATP-hydrolysing)
VPFHDRTALQPGATVAGPAIVCEAHGTTVVEVGWTLSVDDAGALVMTRSAAAEVADDEGPEESRIELFTSRFESIAKEMGEMLRRTALSTNIKERLDFSCALLNLTANSSSTRRTYRSTSARSASACEAWSPSWTSGPATS